MWEWNDAELAGDEHFTAQAAITYFLSSRGLTLRDLSCHPVVIGAFQPYLHRHLTRLLHAERAPHWVEPERAPLAHGQVDGAPVSLILLPVGAPWTTLLCEQLIAVGARTIIAVGAAGSLDDRAPFGSLVVPTAALREEGTSYHYVPPEVEATPAPALADALAAGCRARGVEPLRGVNWTTDGVFREMRTKVERLRGRGIVSVDMEASAMFILGAHRGVDVASLFIVSDELFHPWRPAFYDAGYRARVNLAGEIAAAVAGERATAAQRAGSGNSLPIPDVQPST